MAKYRLIAHDAQGFDPDINPEMLLALFEVAGKTVRVPASLLDLPEPERTQQLDQAIYGAAEIDPGIIQLYQAWEAIKAQSASRPIANMDITEMHAWITANIANANTAIAFRNVATELFIIRAQMRIIEALFRNIFDA